MPGQQLIMHKITKIADSKFSYLKKNYYSMKNHVLVNPIIVDFKRINFILVIYKALHFTLQLFYRRVAEVSYNSCAFP